MVDTFQRQLMFTRMRIVDFMEPNMVENMPRFKLFSPKSMRNLIFPYPNGFKTYQNKTSQHLKHASSNLNEVIPSKVVAFYCLLPVTICLTI